MNNKSVSIEDFGFILNKNQFSQSNFNCAIQSNSTNGLIELIAIKDIKPNEELICWFTDSYLNNMKCNLRFKILFFSIQV